MRLFFSTPIRLGNFNQANVKVVEIFEHVSFYKNLHRTLETSMNPNTHKNTNNLNTVDPCKFRKNNISCSRMSI